jgi:hypothetical protein
MEGSEEMTGRTSVLGGICAVILAVVGFFREWRKYRTDGKRELKERIDAVQAALNLALEDGRITDAQRLQRELTSLWCRYRRTAVIASVLLASLCSGCLSGKPSQYIVIGERINIVEPGQEIVVPNLLPPAKKWYLVDNVGLAGWLGIEAPER